MLSVIGNTDDREVIKFLRTLEQQKVEWKQAAEGQEIGKLILLIATQEETITKETLAWMDDHAEQHDTPVVLVYFGHDRTIGSDCITLRYDGIIEQQKAVKAILNGVK
jgi:hypothetical protein